MRVRCPGRCAAAGRWHPGTASRWGAGVDVLPVHGHVRPARQHVIAAGRVGIIKGRDGAEDGELIGQARESRHQLADLDAGDGGRNGFELAADVGRLIRLGVPSGVLRRPAHQEEDDTRFGPADLTTGRVGRRCRAGGQQAGECQAAETETARPQHFPPIQSITKLAAPRSYGKHGSFLMDAGLPPWGMSLPGRPANRRKEPGKMHCTGSVLAAIVNLRWRTRTSPDSNRRQALMGIGT